MPVYRDQRMLRRNLLLKECWNMILMQNATTMIIITARDMTAVIIMEKIMSVVIITGKVSTAAIRRVTRAAAVITASKPPRGRQNEHFTGSLPDLCEDWSWYFDAEAKQRRHETVFPKERQRAFELGAALVDEN